MACVEGCFVACSLPAIGTDRKQHVCRVFILQRDTVQSDDGIGVGHMEQMSLTIGERTAVHREVGVAAVGIARERLVNHDGIEELGMTVTLRVADGHLAVVQRDTILALDADTF